LKKLTFISILFIVACLFFLNLESSTFTPTIINIGNITLGNLTLEGDAAADHYAVIWDLTKCDLILRATVDLNGMVDDFGGDAHAWSEFGVRTVGYGDFNPTWMVEGAGVWLATDYDWSINTFDPDPPGSPILDLDDKMILQKAGGHGEADYNLPSIPPNPGANHRVWFDRDGIDPFQALNPLAIDGGTYNTFGTYDVVITLHANDATTGIAYMTINGLNQGFETDGNWSTMELTPAGMTFTGDMTQMQVFYGIYGYGAIHQVIFNNLEMEGCLYLEDGMATGGGWFIPEESNFVGITPGGKATFGFVAKQKNETPSGNIEFQYHADDLKFNSRIYDWVQIANVQAMFEGIGKLNGEDGYKFRVRAVDGDKNSSGPDRFEIRIWMTGNGTTWDMPTYRAEGDLGGGQIVVHKK
jgi:hypothetical protein